MMQRRSSIAVTLAVAVLAAATLAGCGSSTSGSSTGGDDGTITVAVPSPVTSLNPVQLGTGIPDQLFLQPAYDSLIMEDSTGALQPELAASWKYTDTQNRDFQITLRSGLKFADGTALDATALKTWINWCKSGNGLFAARFAGVSSVTVDSPLTVTMHLKASDAAWPSSFTQDNYGYVVSPKGIASQKALGTQTFGAGPYVLDKADTVTGSSYVYTKNPDYWNAGNVHADKLVIKVITDSSARLSAAVSGEVDVAIGDSETAASAGNSVNVITAPFDTDSVILMDRSGSVAKPLGDVRVRQALNYAIDRTAVTKAVFGSYGQPNVSMVTDAFQSFTSATDSSYAYDPAKAKQLLAAAGYPDGFTFTAVVTNREGLETTFSQALTGYLKAVGVTMKLEEISDPAAAVNALFSKKYSAFTFFGPMQESNLLTQQQLLPMSGLLNIFGYADPTLDALYGQYQASTSPTAQKQLLQQMQSRIISQAYYLPVSVSDAVYFVSKKVTGVDVSAAEPNLNLYTIRSAS